MKNFISYEKLSKKEKRKVDAAKRKQWSDFGCMCSASKAIPDKKKQADKHRCRSTLTI